MAYTITQLYRSKNDIRKLSEADKEKEFKSSSNNTTAILLEEYMTGMGKKDHSFDDSYPITKDIKRGLSTARAYHNFYKDIKEGTVKEGVEYKYYIGYGSSQNENFASKVRYHLNSTISDNMAEFYRGGMTYYISIKGSKMTIRVVDHYETNSASGAGYIIQRIPGMITPMGQTNLELKWNIDAKDVLIDFKGVNGEY